MDDTASRIYDSLATLEDVAALVTQQREEDLYLEFKKKRDTRTADVEAEDRKKLSGVLSSFANADGGVCVWGIATKKSPSRPDHAAELKPLDDVDAFRARILDLTLVVIQPAIDGLKAKTIRDETGAGYFIIMIPKSFRPPHRAVFDERLYITRTSTGTRRMEHFELEEVFGRRLRPVIVLRLELWPRIGDRPMQELRLYALNEGRSVAKHVGVMCEFLDAGVEATDGPCMENVTRLNGGHPTVAYYDAQDVIHANGIWRRLGSAFLRRPTATTPLNVKVRWYGEEMETASFDGRGSI